MAEHLLAAAAHPTFSVVWRNAQNVDMNLNYLGNMERHTENT
jgi:hypothetical protein